MAKRKSADMREAIIAALDEWRARRKLSLRDAAAIVGAHWTNINRLGRHHTSLERLVDMADRCPDIEVKFSVVRVNNE